MNDTLTYIEAYFQNELSEKERRELEQRCEADESFAGEVAFYITIRQSVKDELLRQKQQAWQTATVTTLPASTTTLSVLRQPWLRYAAAACIILVASLFFLLKPVDSSTVAQEYIDQHYKLSVSMGVADSLDMGKFAYSNKQYDTAVILFETLAKSHPDNAEAKEWAGVVYLATKNYNKALQSFDALAGMGLQYNPGKLLKAMTMLMRNSNGDKQNAKQLLEQVVRENLEGSEEAKKLLKKL